MLLLLLLLNNMLLLLLLLLLNNIQIMEFPLYLVANTLLLVDFSSFFFVFWVFLLIFISEILTKIGFLR